MQTYRYESSRDVRSTHRLPPLTEVIGSLACETMYARIVLYPGVFLCRAALLYNWTRDVKIKLTRFVRETALNCKRYLLIVSR